MASYKLELDPPKRNVFVTQLRDHEEDESTNVRKYPIVQESSSQLVATGIKTLQSTLLIKQTAEADNVEAQLEEKRQEFRNKMAACRNTEERLRRRQRQIKERVNKFDKFINETEAKRRRALEKFHAENKLKEQKTKELEVHTEELKHLKQRHLHLQKKVEKYSAYEKYLMKVLDIIPADYIENSSDSMLLGIMMRFEALNSTNQSLRQTLAGRTDEIKVQQQIIQDIEQKYNQQLVIDSSELASLQHQLETQTQGNARQEHNLHISEETYRNQSKSLGRAKLAVLNIAEKCTRKHSPPLGNMDLDQMLTLIKDFMLEHEDICRMARRLETPLTMKTATNEASDIQSLSKKDYEQRKSLKPMQSLELNSKERRSSTKLKPSTQTV